LIDFFNKLEPGDWMSFVGTILGSLVGTLLAGLISANLLKKELKNNFILNNDELRKTLLIYKTSFIRIYNYSKGILAGKLKDKDEELILRDFDNHVQLIMINFDINKLPADLIYDFKYLISILQQLRSLAVSKQLDKVDIKDEYRQLFNEKEFERLNETYKEQYESIFKKLQLDI